jgi:ABC-type antimicrobial peptide transport system permease subunit
VATSVRDALRGLDPDVTVRRIETVRDAVRDDLQYPRANALFAILVGGSALGLAVMGVFGVTAFVVTQRRHEVGIRVALGASGRSVVRLMLRESLRPVVLGLGAGLTGAFFVGQVVQANLYGIGARDPIALIAAIVVLLLAATIAAFMPARQAARVNPVEMLRQ